MFALLKAISVLHVQPFCFFLLPDQKADLCLQRISYLSVQSQGVLFSVLKAFSPSHRVTPLYLHWSLDPLLSPHRRFSPSSHLCCPLGSEKISPPSFWNIPLSFYMPPCFLSFQVAVTDWGQTKHCRVFLISLTPSRGDESCELSLSVTKTLPRHTWEWDLNRIDRWALGGN